MTVHLLLTFLLSLASFTAHAWGTQGHQVIASIAQAQLTTKAKAEIGKLLAAGARRDLDLYLDLG